MNLSDLLDSSAATDAFKADLIAFVEHGPAPRIQTGRFAPRVKVLRVVAQLLHAEPDLEIESVHVDGNSGCADFRGTISVIAAGQPLKFDFVWDCQWRAVQQGWTDHFGLPDQIRAAREFGWRCFQHWQPVDSSVPGTPPAEAVPH